MSTQDTRRRRRSRQFESIRQDKELHVQPEVEVEPEPEIVDDPAEDIIDGEVLEEETEQTADSRADTQPLPVAYDVVRARQARYAQDTWNDRIRDAAASGRVGVDERDGMVDTGNTSADLSSNLEAARNSFEHGLLFSGFFDDQSTQKQRESSMDGLQRAYAMRMNLSLMEAMRLNAHRREGQGMNLIRVAGMATSMYMFSPTFRRYTNEVGTQIAQAGVRQPKKMVEHLITEQRQRELNKVRQAEGRAHEKGLPVGERWERRRRSITQAMEHREVHTVTSAAMTEVALSERAYAWMRQEGADVDAVRTSHDALVTRLYDQVVFDGLDPQQVAAESRRIVGQRLAQDPHAATTYQDLSHGVLSRSMDAEDRWDGRFRDLRGAVVNVGSFDVREPMTAAEHQATMTDAMASHMLRTGDPTSLHTTIVALAWGQQSEFDPELRQVVEPGARRLIDTGLMMKQAMYEDGMSPEMVQQVYSESFLDSLDVVRQENPDLEEQWVQAAGTDLRADMEAILENPRGWLLSREDINNAKVNFGRRSPSPGHSQQASADPQFDDPEPHA